VTVIAAYLRTGRHHRPTSWSDRSADVAAWLLEAGLVIRSALSAAAITAVAASVLLIALPWRS
jgi:hypothetical protein